MIFKVKIWGLILAGIFFLKGEVFAGQWTNFQAEERTKAVALFNTGKFPEALPLFVKLANAYPSDYLLKYYAGASMIESGTFTKDAEMYLLFAISSDVPAKAYYYLGRYYHAKEIWDNAVRFYNRFRNNAPADEVEKLRVNDLINLAYDKYNPFTGNEIRFPEKAVQHENSEQTPNQIPETTATSTTVIPETAEEKQDNDVSTVEQITENEDDDEEIIIEETVVIEEPVAPAIPLTDFIHFQVNSQVVYLKEELFQEPEALKLWKKARDKESELQQVLENLEEKRAQYQKTSNPAERDKLANQILTYETLSLTTKMEAEQLYAQARSIEQKWWDGADYSAYEKYLSINDSLKKLEEQARQAAISQPVIDMALIEEYFRAEEEDEEEDHGVVYKIQLGSFTRALPARTKTLFDKIGIIRPVETFTDEQGATVYTTGNVKTYEAALELQEQVRLEGVKEAITIAMKDDRIIPIEEAKKLTGEDNEEDEE